MRSTTQEKLLNILFKALKPFVHLLLESGIGHREFSEIAKKAYVDVATKRYGIRGRNTNISRVAVMTGLTRKEVKRIREELQYTEDAPNIRPVPASLVLHHWFTDPDYLDANGDPRELSFDAEENGFRGLVRKYAGDIPPGAIRTELLRTSAISVSAEGLLFPLRREFIAMEGKDRILRAFDRPLTALGLNLEHNNLFRAPSDNEDDGWPERIVQISFVDKRHRAKAIRLIEQRVRAFSEELDDTLAPFEKTAGEVESSQSAGLSIGLGMYYFES